MPLSASLGEHTTCAELYKDKFVDLLAKPTRKGPPVVSLEMCKEGMDGSAYELSKLNMERVHRCQVTNALLQIEP